MRIPKFECKAGCTACCTLVPFTPKDQAAISALRPDLEWAAWGDDWVLADALETMRCPLNDGTGCTIHGTDAYPMICRLYGVVDHPRMTCGMGGKASRKLTDREARRLLRRA